jgi:titin
VPCDGLVVQGDNANINGLVIKNFSGNGLVFRGAGAYASSVQNSYIGTDSSGTAAAPNGLSGILVDGGYGNPIYGNFIGSNLISGNTVGITVNGAGANGTAIIRNKIGTNAAGTARIPNLDDGIRIIGAPNTLIGQPGDGNVISGNGTVLNGFVNRYADAIDVSGAGATGTIIQGNYLGLDANGANGLFNTVDNIHVTGAPNTKIGGTAAGAGNVIGDDGTVNYAFAHCIHVEGAGATGLIVQGNKIGTNLAGTADRGCRGAGIFIDGASGAQIGGTVAAARNLISGNNNYGGVVINNGATGTIVQGNYIGTDVTGTAAIGNGAHGVSMNSGGNTIGGTAPGAGNVISGNSARGIDLVESGASNNTIQGNFIGTNAAGTAGIPNVTYGIFILRAQNNLIGGTVTAARNLISGNGEQGIYIAGSDGAMCNGNVIQGNYIGTDVTGTAAIGNTMGVDLYYAANITVGGPAPGAGNLISGNRAGNGVRIYSFGLNTSGILVQGNRIGTNAAVTAKVPNNGEGIWGTITGTASILGNVVSGNASLGIYLNRGSFIVQGNWIGTDSTGTLNLGNAWSGIYTTSQEASLIGGSAPGEGNVIAFSGAPNTGLNFAGVSITGSAARQTVRGNRVFANPGLGIDITHFSGVSANDACDTDSGPNAIQNFPVITTAFLSGSSTRVIGTLNSTASTPFTVDFYSSPACDSFGNGEGSTYLGSTTVTTGGTCDGSFSVLVPAPASGVVTATATDPLGNTSEFSACTALTPGPVAEVTGVSWPSKSELTWSAAAGASIYRVLRGTSASLPDLLDADLDSCTRFSGSALTSGPVLTENPATAGVPFYWYLVVGSNGTDDGPFGPTTAGPRVANPSGACP